MASWRKSYEIVWHGECPEGVEEKTRASIDDELRDLGKPSDLVFHTVWTDEQPHGPTVLVWGEKRDRRFHAEYAEDTEYVSLQEAFQ